MYYVKILKVNGNKKTIIKIPKFWFGKITEEEMPVKVDTARQF